VQTDPIYVEFSMPEAEAARVRKATAAGRASLNVQLLADDGSPPRTGGKLSFIDTSVEPGSGTVRARAVFPNADRQLVPGQFLRVRVDGVAAEDATSVPRRAVMSSAQGSFVWVVAQGEVVALRPVRIAGESGDRALIGEGLQPGERVVVEGVLKVRPGDKVSIAAAAVAPPGPGNAPAAAEPAQ
jgi:membrane fusion protein, multidrug efflux system